MPVPKKKKPKRVGTRKQDSATWQLQAAKAHFSELVRRARANGPQTVTKQGKEEVVVLPIEQYKELTARSKQPKSLVQFFAESPLADADLDLERTPDYGREIEL